MKLSICLGVATLAIVKAASWAVAPHNIGPSGPRTEPVSDHLEEEPGIKLNPGQWDTTIHMPPLDVSGKRTNKQSVPVGRWICGEAENMAGTWDGLGYSFYGRVQRCEWM